MGKGHRTVETSVSDSDAQKRLEDGDFHLPGVTDNPDDPRLLKKPLPEEALELWDRVKARLDAGEFELPRLPSNSMALVRLACDDEADVGDIVSKLKKDPPLASALLAAANSVGMGGQVPIESLDGAVIRVGLNGLRSLVLSLSIRSSIFSGRNLPAFAKQVWRQAYSCGAISREIHELIGLEPEKGFMLGLIHDIGKISLLALLHECVTSDQAVPRILVTQLFAAYHEEAGRRLADAWLLPAEISDLAGQHHDYESNKTQRVTAAVCSLAHRLDLTLCLARIEQFRSYALAEDEAPEFRALGIGLRDRATLLLRTLDLFKSTHHEFE